MKGHLRKGKKLVFPTSRNGGRSTPVEILPTPPPALPSLVMLAWGLVEWT